ncbi:MAG: YfhO family protein, partial [Bacteroidia bacterium]|nr:YfhO family protein [Bacteroidia bacterium]
VYNTTQRLDQDALTSYYHKSIGGYHGAKMRRYQEVIDILNKQLASTQNLLNPVNNEIYAMLNVKYFIGADSANRLFAQLNPSANGNAWFVKNYVLVDNADAEYAAIQAFNSKETCYIDKRFADDVKGVEIKPDSSATIKLTLYQPNKLVYESTTSSPQIAVFSEVFYDKGWNAYIDGNLVNHFRCDYILRGLKIPEGKHSIEFKFEPKAVQTGQQISLVSSILLYGGLVLVLLFNIFKRPKTSN